MSVLYKALQKAEKENEQRQAAAPATGFDAERLAGSGAIRLAGGRGINWRVTGLAAAVVLAVAIGAAFFLVEPDTAPPPRQVAAVAPKPAQPAAPAAAPVLQPPSGQDATAPAAAASAPPAPAQVAASAPAEAAPPAPQPSPAPQVAAAVPAPVSAPAPVANAPAALTPAPAAASPAPAAKEPEKQVAAAAPVPAKPAAPKAASKPAPAPASKEPMPDIAADSPARMLSPPIAISRAEFALSGVGKAVQVREVSQDAQDNVGAGYNALVSGQYDTALGFYERALQKEPRSVMALLGRGAALQKLHRNEEAQASYDRVLKLDPNNREALTNLTAIVGDRSPNEALARLLELEKDNPAFSPIKAQIGLTYAKLGSLDQALDYLRRAVQLNPDAPMYQYDLAVVLDRMGLRDQAAAAYQTVLDAAGTGRNLGDVSTTDIERRVRFLRVH